MQLDDGLDFNVGASDVEAIRSDDTYPGIRVTLRATLATAKLVFHVDVNVGDPVWPGPIEISVPRMLTSEPIVLQGYPLAMVLAEKIVTALQRRSATSRWRDFADVLLLTQRNTIDGRELNGALGRVAAYRQQERILLAEALDGFAPLGQDRWQRWRRAQRLEDRLPLDFAEVLDGVASFADPALSGRASAMTWSPTNRRWGPRS